MHDQLEKIKAEYEELNNWLARPDSAGSPEFAAKSKRLAELAPTAAFITKLLAVEEELGKSQVLLSKETDRDMFGLIEDEIVKLTAERDALNNHLSGVLLETDPNDKKDAIVEIRAGAGGDESAYFAGSLFEMYERYGLKNGFKISRLSSNKNDLGGFKEIVFSVEGVGAYSKFKYESGVHRVQRVPVTESSGRIHTSTATVAILLKADEIDIAIRPEDLKIDTYHSSGAGGQSVNTADSAVRITYLPSNMVVTCQDERSQLKNRERAMSILRARLYKEKQEADRKARGEARKSQIGTGERSEKIRTYNFPQDRITDHRIGLTVHNIQNVLDGNLDLLVMKLSEADKEKALNNS